ncbi:hypothetical protein HU200_045659 [Digitaria exilis]|uniref:Plant heme peroxidase family profile domain-containing protein n=1 Tax=Digitaria exilis TaxID=1010633 RepID=A0A835B7E2_9POAL|nr:hypothetical protein HU200_045659 [Digitaria exilis]
MPPKKNRRRNHQHLSTPRREKEKASATAKHPLDQYEDTRKREVAKHPPDGTDLSNPSEASKKFPLRAYVHHEDHTTRRIAAHCASYQGHIYYNDTNINQAFARSLQASCPAASGGGANVRQRLHFNNLLSQKGLLHSDQELFNGASTDNIPVGIQQRLRDGHGEHGYMGNIRDAGTDQDHMLRGELNQAMALRTLPDPTAPNPTAHVSYPHVVRPTYLFAHRASTHRCRLLALVWNLHALASCPPACSFFDYASVFSSLAIDLVNRRPTPPPASPWKDELGQLPHPASYCRPHGIAAQRPHLLRTARSYAVALASPPVGMLPPVQEKKFLCGLKDVHHLPHELRCVPQLVHRPDSSSGTTHSVSSDLCPGGDTDDTSPIDLLPTSVPIPAPIPVSTPATTPPDAPMPAPTSEPTTPTPAPMLAPPPPPLSCPSGLTLGEYVEDIAPYGEAGFLLLPSRAHPEKSAPDLVVVAFAAATVICALPRLRLVRRLVSSPHLQDRRVEEERAPAACTPPPVAPSSPSPGQQQQQHAAYRKARKNLAAATGSRTIPRRPLPRRALVDVLIHALRLAYHTPHSPAMSIHLLYLAYVLHDILPFKRDKIAGGLLMWTEGRANAQRFTVDVDTAATLQTKAGERKKSNARRTIYGPMGRERHGPPWVLHGARVAYNVATKKIRVCLVGEPNGTEPLGALFGSRTAIPSKEYSPDIRDNLVPEKTSNELVPIRRTGGQRRCLLEPAAAGGGNGRAVEVKAAGRPGRDGAARRRQDGWRDGIAGRSPIALVKTEPWLGRYAAWRCSSGDRARWSSGGGAANRASSKLRLRWRTEPAMPLGVCVCWLLQGRPRPTIAGSLS